MDNTEKMNTTEKLCAMIRQRAEVGLKKYGVTVDRKDLTAEQWLQHSIEEKIDDLKYMMRLREEIVESTEYARKLSIKVTDLGKDIENLKTSLNLNQDAGDLLFEELDDLTPEPRCECIPGDSWPCKSCEMKRARAAIEAWKEANK